MKNGKRTFILTEIVLGLLVATLAFFMLYNKNEQKADYEAEIKYKKEKIIVNFNYSTESNIGVKKSAGTAERIE